MSRKNESYPVNMYHNPKTNSNSLINKLIKIKEICQNKNLVSQTYLFNNYIKNYEFLSTEI